MIDPERVEILYESIRLHFGTTNYDFFKYRGTVNKRKRNRHYRQMFIQFLAKKFKHEEVIIDFLVSNRIHDQYFFKHAMVTEETMDVFRNYQKRKQAVSYYLKSDLMKLKEYGPITELIACTEWGSLPRIIQLFQRKEITLDTLVFVNKVHHCIEHWNTAIHDDIEWPAFRLLFTKYAPFCEGTFNQLTAKNAEMLVSLI